MVCSAGPARFVRTGPDQRKTAAPSQFSVHSFSPSFSAIQRSSTLLMALKRWARKLVESGPIVQSYRHPSNKVLARYEPTDESWVINEAASFGCVGRRHTGRQGSGHHQRHYAPKCPSSKIRRALRRHRRHPCRANRCRFRSLLRQRPHEATWPNRVHSRAYQHSGRRHTGKKACEMDDNERSTQRFGSCPRSQAGCLHSSRSQRQRPLSNLTTVQSRHFNECSAHSLKLS